MKINKQVINDILHTLPVVPPERGGIIGGEQKIVDKVYFDNRISIMENAMYIPDIKTFNFIIKNWNSKGIGFMGIFHSHLKGNETLSTDDIKFIEDIMDIMPYKVKELYFPIVIPKEKIIVYKSIRGSKYIINEKIEVIGGEV